jgi:hypothetical protein
VRQQVLSRATGDLICFRPRALVGLRTSVKKSIQGWTDVERAE